MKLLCLSNGHGEDLIAVQILEQLQRYPNAPEVAALPLVGSGNAYTKHQIPIIGPVKQMPSGGFIYMDGRQLWQDVRGGLLGLTLAQFRVIRKWNRHRGAILAVGDIVPLLFAWLSGTNFAFVGTAKSEYYIRNESGRLLGRGMEGWSGSVYLPWERYLMQSRSCKGVFPRDRLTTTVLKQFNIPAYDLGNPMMDGIEPEFPPPVLSQLQAERQEKERPLTMLLLPGSRPPEAYQNWSIILEAVTGVIRAFEGRTLLFLGAIASTLNLETFAGILARDGWELSQESPSYLPFVDPDALIFHKENCYLLLSQKAYNACLLAADFAIAMAGTATEQFVGLGKPVISLVGKGPQFTAQFAEAQTRLLGNSIYLAKNTASVGKLIQGILVKPDILQLIALNGEKRMGKPGAGARIAEKLMQIFIPPENPKQRTNL